ncbi:ExeA family protein [Desulfobacter curvatus]|uniref:ExeA family protein n=1 Tax=Desulfobacter curvatus TaxID=2290 RepID=UPI00037D6AFA|nr:AAA family ATPase [Desulfobacter curvatus]
MYCTHFNLKKKPFQLSSDNSFLWLGDTHARALGLLKAGIDGSQRLMVLTGDIGTGKTTLIHELRQCLPQTTAVAHVTDPSIELDYLFRSIAQDLGFDALYGEGEEFAPILSAFLNRRHQAREKCLIIIDEAHLIPERFLALLPSWVKVAPDKTLTVILAGQLELHQVMEETLGRSWKEQVDVRAMLFPLEEEQTRDYINRRLELAGAAHSIFTPGAVREVHRYTKGIPRRINIACDQAMIAACAKDMQTVDAQIFHEAVGILELPLVPMAVSQPALVAPKSRRSVRVLPALAAAVLLVVVAYISYFRVLSVPPPEATAAHGDLPGAGARLEAFQAESYEPVESQAATLEPSKVSLLPSEQIVVKPRRSADMDAFIKEVFIMHKADSMARVPDPSHQPSAHNVPASETPASGPAHESVRASSAQPEPDAIIDWLIKEKSQ